LLRGKTHKEWGLSYHEEKKGKKRPNRRRKFKDQILCKWQAGARVGEKVEKKGKKVKRAECQESPVRNGKKRTEKKPLKLQIPILFKLKMCFSREEKLKKEKDGALGIKGVVRESQRNTLDSLFYMPLTEKISV